MSEMRQQFEAWVADNSHSDLNRKIILQKDEDGEYKLPRTGDRWRVWQASRAALVVELPGWDDFDTTMQVLSAVIDELKSEGITVKGESQ